MGLLRRAPDTVTLDLLEEAGRNIQRATLLLRDLLAEYPERSELARDLLLCEQEGDRITHDIIHRLNGGGMGQPPMDPADGHQLATTLDDIVDFAEQAADELSLYAVEAPMEQATLIADVLVGAGGQVAPARGRPRRPGAALPALGRRDRAPPGGDPPPRERGRPAQPRRGRLAVRQRHRPDGRHPLEGPLRDARAERRRVREGGPRARGHLAQARPAPALIRQTAPHGAARDRAQAAGRRRRAAGRRRPLGRATAGAGLPRDH